MKKFLFITVPIILLAPISYLVYSLAFNNPEFIEYTYSRGIYPAITQISGWFSSLFSFSVFEVLLYAFILFCIVWMVYTLCSIFAKRGKKLISLIKRVSIFLCVLSALYFCFVFGWALNYARQPLSKTMGYTISALSDAELYNIAQHLAQQASSLREQVLEDEHGVFKLKESKAKMLQRADEIYAPAPYFMRLGRHTDVKGVATKNIMSTLNITGIFSPFTFEPNVNMQIPDLHFPITVCHEYAHLKGFAREDEANFIAFYLCYQSDDVELKYSAVNFALMYFMDELPAQYKLKLSPKVIKDMQASSAYWQAFRSDIGDASTQMNDNYLKSNKQEAGIRSYNNMIYLIAEYYKQMPG